MKEDGPVDRCHSYRGVHIPGCIGCAVGGHERCTCPRPAEERRDLARKVEALEHTLARLERAFYSRGEKP